MKYEKYEMKAEPIRMKNEKISFREEKYNPAEKYNIFSQKFNPNALIEDVFLDIPTKVKEEEIYPPNDLSSDLIIERLPLYDEKNHINPYDDKNEINLEEHYDIQDIPCVQDIKVENVMATSVVIPSAPEVKLKKERKEKVPKLYICEHCDY